MGFLSALGKLGSFIPVVGPAIGAASEILGGQEKGKAQGQISRAELQQAQDRNALAKYQAEQNAQNVAAQTDLDRKKYADSAAGQNATRAILSGLLGGGQLGSHVSVPGVQSQTLAGGPLAALAANPDALAALSTLGGRSSQMQQAEPTFTGGDILKAPTLTPLPDQKSGGFLSTLARIGQIAGGVSPFLPKKKDDTVTMDYFGGPAEGYDDGQ